MDPMSRKRKIIGAHDKDIEINNLRKKLAHEKNTRMYHTHLGNNGTKYILRLHAKIRQVIPYDVRKELALVMNTDFQNFIKANGSLRTTFKNYEEQYNKM